MKGWFSAEERQRLSHHEGAVRDRINQIDKLLDQGFGTARDDLISERRTLVNELKGCFEHVMSENGLTDGYPHHMTIVVIAPNVSERMGGEAMKALRTYRAHPGCLSGGVHQPIGVIKRYRSALAQIYFIIQRRSGAGLAKVYGAVLDREYAVRSRAGRGREDAAAAGTIRPLIAVERHELVGSRGYREACSLEGIIDRTKRQDTI